MCTHARAQATEEEEGCGPKLLDATRWGDEATMRRLLSRQDAKSFINVTDETDEVITCVYVCVRERLREKEKESEGKVRDRVTVTSPTLRSI
jgi:hypothetical protein